MSRSTKKKPGIGKEYWGKRPISNHHGAEPGRVTKEITNGKERMAAKEEIRGAPREPEYDPREYVGCDLDGLCDCNDGQSIEQNKEL